MHGHSPGSDLLVNAEVDSMGGVIDGGVGIDSKFSPRRAAIEKAQAELRQEYDVREERRRELEFLEKGGNPLDFKIRPATSVSVQSTSLTDQPVELLVTSEAKGSSALVASPHGDSVDSSGKPGVPPSREPNSGDNLLLFDSENYSLEGRRNSKHTGRRNNIASSEQSSQLGGNRVKDSEDAVISPHGKSQAYARRNRSRSSRDSAWASSTDIAPPIDGNRPSNLPSARHGSRDAKGSISEAKVSQAKAQKDCISHTKSTGPNGSLVSKTLASENQVDMELDAGQSIKAATVAPKVTLLEGPEVTVSRDLQDANGNRQLLVDDDKVRDSTACVSLGLGEQGVSSGLASNPSMATVKTENHPGVHETNGFNMPVRDEKGMQNQDKNGTTALSTKGLESESSSTQITHILNGNTSNDPCLDKVQANGNPEEQQTIFGENLVTTNANLVKRHSETNAVDALVANSNVHDLVQQNLSNNVSDVKFEEEICDSRSHLQNEGRPPDFEAVGPGENVGPKTENKLDNSSGDNSNLKKPGFSPQGGPSSTAVSSNCELQDPSFCVRGRVTVSEPQTCTGNQLKVSSKEHEDFILKEAQTIEAKRKRIAELSVGNLPSEYRRKSHWDFVLEEMAWLANDFIQERIWKITAAAQMCHMVAITGRLRFKEQNISRKQRKLAHVMAKAVLQFWHSAKKFLNNNDPTVGLKEWNAAFVRSRKANASEVTGDRVEEHNTETGKHMEGQNSDQNLGLAIQGYAVRFLKSNSLHGPALQDEASVTPDRISGFGSPEMEEHFSRESLFYTVPPGAMEDYRKLIELHWAQHEKTGNNMQQEEVETSIYDASSEFGSRENAYEEDGGGTGTYYSPGNIRGRKPSKFVQKKRKTLLKSYPPRSHEVGADLLYGQCMDNKLTTQSSSLVGKRPNDLAVGSIPTKRMRTASRQRACPFGATATGSVQITNKTDVSSGDTNSFQDDQNTVHGGSQFRKEMEAESTGEFGKQSFDYADTLMKPKKKKKAKNVFYKNSFHPTEAPVLSGKGVAYEQRWQLDSMAQSEQRDHPKRRTEGHYFESNGNNGLFGQPVTKKPKIIKQLADTSPENFPPVTNPSPVASQMSNMSNPNKLMKMIAGRDRGRKAKALKVPAGNSESGSPWSLFEDQALVVLVHDMGPNWELVSDAINSTLQFKCIFRKPKECKERHKNLMDRNGGDGADSAEDSGSSQPYPSTLPGIPKGSARQLFQRLHGPMEEDTLKSHFEKIILLGQQMLSRKSQNDNQALKQISPVHNSHAVALSQVCPNNLNGVPLTPLDLCDATTSSSDAFPPGYQGSHNNGLAISNQGSVAPVLPMSGANSMLQGSSGMTLGNSLPSPSSGLSASTRYGAPRAASQPVDDQQRMQQQYNQMPPGRNIQQPGMSVSGAMPGTDRGVRMLPGGNGMGMMSGMNRMPRPGFQGMGSAAMLNTASMLSPGAMGMPSSVNMHTGAVPVQGNSMLGHRDGLHLMRPVQNPEDQRQMMMQGTQGSSQGVPPYNGLSTAFPNQTIPPPVPPFPVQHQQHQIPPQQSHVLGNPHHPRLQGNSHAANPQQQAYMIRLAKERQLQQQQFLHHQQQFAAANPLMPHPQPHTQHPISSMQNSSQIQPQVSSQPVSMPPLTSQHPLTPSSPMNPISSQPQQKHQLQPHSHGRNPQASGVNLPNQMMRQRQRQQQLQQLGRHHPQQRQQSQPQQQQAKLMKGLGRGNMMIHQNVAIDPSNVNGFPTAPGNQVAEKGEKAMPLMQGQGLYPGLGSSSIQTGKQMAPQSANQLQPQQKMFPRPPPPSSKQLPQMPSHPDNCNQGQVPSVSSVHVLPSQQAAPPSSMASHQQQHPPQQRQAGQPPHAIQRMLQQSRQMSSDPPLHSPVEHIQVTQQPGNNAFQMATSTSVPQSSIEPSSSAASSSQWKAPEPLYDAGSPNAATNSAAAGNSPYPNTKGTESMSSPSQGLVQRQFSGSMSVHGHNVGKQWLQPPQQSQPLQPPLPPPAPAPALAPQQHLQQVQQQQQPPPPAQPSEANQSSQQHQQEPPQQQQLPQPPESRQHQSAVESDLHSRPTNSGSG